MIFFIVILQYWKHFNVYRRVHGYFSREHCLELLKQLNNNYCYYLYYFKNFQDKVSNSSSQHSPMCPSTIQVYSDALQFFFLLTTKIMLEKHYPCVYFHSYDYYLLVVVDFEFQQDLDFFEQRHYRLEPGLLTKPFYWGKPHIENSRK